MFDTPTTAFYHPRQEDGKNKSFFTIFPTISSINIPLSGYFQQPSQQQQEIKASPSAETITDLNDSITTVPFLAAPQQPTHVNRRTQRRLPPKTTSVSTNIAATASQRSVLPPNMGNISSSSVAQPSKASSPVAQSSKASSSGNHHHRRKKHLNRINRKKVDDAITLSAFAVEEDNQGNHEDAMNHYLNALESMLEALPIQYNQTRRDALKNKLRDFMDREGLTDDFMESTNASSIAKAAEREEFKPSTDSKSGISQHIIQAAITSAVALKQSPIPDAISATVNYTMKKIQKIDRTYGLQNKAWEMSRTGINLALEIDQQYNVHEKVGNALFTGIAAAMKAGIAYKDSPSYRELQKMRTEFEHAGTSSVCLKKKKRLI